MTAEFVLTVFSLEPCAETIFCSARNYGLRILASRYRRSVRPGTEYSTGGYVMLSPGGCFTEHGFVVNAAHAPCSSFHDAAIRQFWTITELLRMIR
jgi:hypothetical protein